jgi:hypothetical protein
LVGTRAGMCARLLGLRDKPARMYGWIIALVTAVHAAAGLAREQACRALPGGWGAYAFPVIMHATSELIPCACSTKRS